MYLSENIYNWHCGMVQGKQGNNENIKFTNICKQHMIKLKNKKQTKQKKTQTLHNSINKMRKVPTKLHKKIKQCKKVHESWCLKVMKS